MFQSNTYVCRYSDVNLIIRLFFLIYILSSLILVAFNAYILVATQKSLLIQFENINFHFCSEMFSMCLATRKILLILLENMDFYLCTKVIVPLCLAFCSLSRSALVCVQFSCARRESRAHLPLSRMFAIKKKL